MKDILDMSPNSPEDMRSMEATINNRGLDAIESDLEDIFATMEKLKNSKLTTTKQRHALGNAQQLVVGIQMKLEPGKFERYSE